MLDRGHDQISLKPYSLFRGQSFALIFKELYQNLCFDDNLVKFEYGSCWVKTRSLFYKTLDHSFASVFMKHYLKGF